MIEIPKIPQEYLGKYSKNCGYTTSNPREWTPKEIEWVKDLSNRGFSYKDIATSVGRTETAISIKMKRLSKKQNTYNVKHVEQKYQMNDDFLTHINPKTILDLYCGEKNFYKDYNVTSNDINPSVNATYNEDALKLICRLYYEGKKYDLIDLDPYGSAYDLFDLAIKMAKKGLIITLGELGHKRWKRLDFVKTHYDIESMNDFTIENLIEYIKKVGKRNKKELVVYQYKEWENTGRVYFEIKRSKVTEQWEKK